MEFTLDLIAEPGVLSPCHFSARKTTEMRVLKKTEQNKKTEKELEIKLFIRFFGPPQSQFQSQFWFFFCYPTAHRERETRAGR